MSDANFINAYNEVVLENFVAVLKQNFMFQTQIKFLEERVSLIPELEEKGKLFDSIVSDKQELENKIVSLKTDIENKDQFNMYLGLIEEEWDELSEAILADDRVEMLDALIDILVVTIGALHSIGGDVEGAWNEVARSNFSKFDDNGNPIRNPDTGKVMKGPNFSPPSLAQFL